MILVQRSSVSQSCNIHNHDANLHHTPAESLSEDEQFKKVVVWQTIPKS